MKKLTNFFLKKRSVNGSLAFGIIGTGVVALIFVPAAVFFIAFSLNQTFKASASIGESIGNTLVKCTIQLIISVLIVFLIVVIVVIIAGLLGPLGVWLVLWLCVQDSWAACFP